MEMRVNITGQLKTGVVGRLLCWKFPGYLRAYGDFSLFPQTSELKFAFLSKESIFP